MPAVRQREGQTGRKMRWNGKTKKIHDFSKKIVWKIGEKTHMIKVYFVYNG